MKELSPSDFFSSRLDAPASIDVPLLLDLYLPIVGAKALGLYLSLSRLANRETSFEELSLLTGLSIGEIDGSLSPLEAIGLLSSYKKAEEGIGHYLFLLRLPASPSSFFSSPLLAGTLRKNAPEPYFELAKARYAPDTPIPSGYLDVGTSYPAYFRPGEVDPAYLEDLKADRRRRSSIKTGFDWNLFLTTLGRFDPRYASLRWSEASRRRIEGLSALYGYTEEAVAGFFDSHYDFSAPVNRRMDWKGLSNDLEAAIKTKGLLKKTPATRQGKRSELTEELFERCRNLPPREFLSSLQNGNRVAAPDLRLLEKVTVEMGLNNEVANGLVHFVLASYDNTLPSSIVEKLAGSLVRENIVTVEDALDYLARTSEWKRKAKKKEKPLVSVETGKKAENEPSPDIDEKAPELPPEEEERKRYFEDFMRSTFD